MTHFMREGNRYAVAPAGALDIHKLLPLGTYKVGFIEMTNMYYLEVIEDFEVSGKIYGSILVQRDRILRTFKDRTTTTGVLLTGEKGSGKTLLAKLLALAAQETGIPTLVINSAYSGDTFNAFMQAIAQPTVVIFDEFEKVYNRDDQEKLLTLLDGTYTSKKLFVLTANDKYKIDTHMLNRPGRIYYRVEFSGLDVDFVREYCQDNLDRKDRIEDVTRASRLFARFNFDVLKALVEEMNRFDEPVEEALEILNARPELGEKMHYDITLIIDGMKLPADKMYDRDGWTGNPLNDSVQVYYYGEPDEDGDLRTVRVLFDPTELKRVDVDTGEFIFEKADGKQLKLTERATLTRANYSMVY